MQVDRQQVADVIRTAIDELNVDLPPEQQVDSSPDIVDWDLECNLRGFDGWNGSKCSNFVNNN